MSVFVVQMFQISTSLLAEERDIKSINAALIMSCMILSGWARYLRSIDLKVPYCHLKH
jgi:hypothetical protein